MFADRLWLGHAKFTQRGLVVGNNRKKLQAPHNFDELLKMGEDIFKSHPKSVSDLLIAVHNSLISNCFCLTSKKIML